MKNLLWSLFLMSLAICSEREPLLSQKYKKNTSGSYLNKVTIMKVKNETQQTLKIVINDQVRFISKPGQEAHMDIPLDFNFNAEDNKYGLKDIIRIMDAKDTYRATFSMILITQDQDVKIISFVAFQGQHTSHITSYTKDPRSSYNIAVIFEGKNVLEKISFQFLD